MALVSSFDGLIFDYGGVLVEHQTDADQARLARILGISKERSTELYWSTRLDYDKGLLSSVDYWQGLAQKAGIRALSETAIEELIQIDVESWLRFDERMWQWVEQLRVAGKRLAMLSNMPRELGEALRTTTDRLNSFDHVTLSYEIHSAKPEPAMYEHCLEGLDTRPERTLFLDDRTANVHAAELLGIHAMEFTSSEAMLLLLGT